MTWRHAAVGAAGALAALALCCYDSEALFLLRPNPLYCDETTPCTDPLLRHCDPDARECRALPPADLAGCAGPSASKDCPDEQPVCDRGTCRACAGPDDDAACGTHDAATPRCEARSGRCVACRADTAAADCGTRAPVCDAGAGACRVCRAHAECAGGACLPDGACAPAAQVAWVDNGGRKPSDCRASGKHDGGKAAPWCDVQDAIDSIPPRPDVVVAGSPEPYGPVVVTDRTLSLLGPTSGLRATVAANGSVHALIINSITTADVTVADIELTAATTGKSGLMCNPNGAARVTMLRVSVHDNNGPGIQSTNCTLLVDAARIAGNQGGGIKVTGGTYVITNSFIAANGLAGPAVVLDASSSGSFAFNTVASNKTNASVGGIDCGGGALRPIEHSIVWGNTLDVGSQFYGRCQLLGVVTGQDMAPGATVLDPAFVDRKNGDYHLVAGDAVNSACCVDKVMSPQTAHRDHDIDGNPRPRGAAWDIGAHEVM